MRLQISDLGIIEYDEALEYQYALLKQVEREEVPDTLLLLEHYPVVTLGKRGEESDMLLPEEELRQRGVSVHRIDRGGQATFHGPGQLVVYPIVNLRNHQRRVKRFVRTIETFVIELLRRHYGIEAHTEEAHVGVWVGTRKIAAIGISIHNAVTMHGLALNVCTELDYFSLIVPCGIRDCGVTSIQKELDREVSVAEVKERAGGLFAELFGYDEYEVRAANGELL